MKQITGEIKQYCFNIPRNICPGYLLELPCRGDSNECPQHMSLRVNNERKGSYHLSYYILGFFIEANSF